ncbi:MAG: phenylalanine--tRNA ligase subunit beta, partial [Beijerinckiaceae bacterium]|nr:phenylalanine--tRNA ligase subunit beta [Beijerinckiaceae bacterium]
SELIVAGEVPKPSSSITFPLNEVERLTGLELPREEKIAILQGLGFTILGTGNEVSVTVPSWRPDVEGKADLVEEIVRIAGVDRVVSVPLEREIASVPKPILTLLQRRKSQARRALAAQGLVEAVNWSFISHDQATLFGGGKPELALANPIAADLSDMRPSLMPGLVSAAGRNADRGFADVGLFEAGQIFLGAGDKDQRQAVGAIRAGTAKAQGSGRHWTGASKMVDVYDAKADALAMLSALGVAVQGMNVVAGGPSWLHPGRSGTMQFGPKNIIGHFGEIHPAILEAFDIDGPICGFEIILDALPAPRAKPTKVKPKLDLPELMRLERDFAFIVDRSVNASDILRAAQSVERSLLADINVFDIYEGTGIPEGKKSVAISVTLQP